MKISEFQHLIEKIYYDKDCRRGVERTFLWFTEEVGELAAAVREKDREKFKAELSDVFAWLAGLASLMKVDLEEAGSVYKEGCPDCKKFLCECREPE